MKELLLAVALADRLLDDAGRAPPARALRARRDDGRLARLADHRAPVLVHRPRQGRLLATRSTRPACCARKLRAARFAVTCTEANRRASAASVAPATPVHRIYHGLNADFARSLGERRGARRRRTARCACSASGGSSPKKGFDVLVEACGLLAERGVAVSRRRSPASDGDARRPSPRAASRARGLEARVRARRPARARPSCSREYRARRRRSACPAACSTTATATGSRTCSSRRWPAGCRS